MITVTQNNSTLSFVDSVKNDFGKELALFNPDYIKKVYSLIDKHTPNKLENLPEMPLYEPALYKSDSEEVQYGITSIKFFKEFIQSLKDSVDLITLNDIIKRNPIFCCPIQIN